MREVVITEKDKKLAQQCIECTICDKARVKQKGFAYWFVKNVESKLGFCPACRAYEKVYGKKVYAPISS